FASPGSVLVLREGDSSASPAELARRGVRHLAYRLARSPEGSAETAFEEGWVDGMGTAEDLEGSLARGAPSAPAPAAASRRLSFPSRRAALALERAEFALLNALPDKQEGIDAFFGRRKARFSPQ